MIKKIFFSLMAMMFIGAIATFSPTTASASPFTTRVDGGTTITSQGTVGWYHHHHHRRHHHHGSGIVIHI
jgi:hypothetical protein